MTLYLDGFTPSDQVGTATVGTGGTFRATASIPILTTAGQHTLYAVQASGGQASTPVTQVRSINPRVVGALRENVSPAAKSNGALTTGVHSGSLRFNGEVQAPSGPQAQTTITVTGTNQGVQRTIRSSIQPPTPSLAA